MICFDLIDDDGDDDDDGGDDDDDDTVVVAALSSGQTPGICRIYIYIHQRTATPNSRLSFEEVAPC